MVLAYVKSLVLESKGCVCVYVQCTMYNTLITRLHFKKTKLQKCDMHKLDTVVQVLIEQKREKRERKRMLIQFHCLHPCQLFKIAMCQV